jgi:low affinity Fe/Cu permease
MVFLIQNTQNRDARAIHLKLDELIRGSKGARNRLVDLENCTDEEIAQLETEFREFRKRRGHRTEKPAQPLSDAGVEICLLNKTLISSG